MLNKKLTTPKLDFYKQRINNIAYSFYFHYAKKFTRPTYIERNQSQLFDKYLHAGN